MKSLDWFYPSVAAGSLRSLLGKQSPSGFDASTVTRLKALQITGPLPVINGELFFPAPRDVLVWQDDEDHRRVAALTPDTLSHGEGCLPADGLRPIAIPDDCKPASVPAWWSRIHTVRWLSDEIFCPPAEPKAASGFWPGPERDGRTHAAIDPETGVATEGRLFQTVALDLALPGQAECVALALRVDNEGDWRDALSVLDSLHPMGGERRLAHWRSDGSPDWSCPARIKQKLAGMRRIRMMLATPAYFRGGWRPGWLDERSLTGPVPGASTVYLKLVGACTGRWLAHSGWSIEKGSFGEKPTNRLVPSGSVYFFELEGGNAEDLANVWLRPVGENPDNAINLSSDGFGLALWGVWED